MNIILQKNCLNLFFLNIIVIILKNSNTDNVPIIIKKNAKAYISITIKNNSKNKIIEV